MSKHALFELFATRRSLNPYLVKLHSPPEIGTDVDDLILILSDVSTLNITERFCTTHSRDFHPLKYGSIKGQKSYLTVP